MYASSQSPRSKAKHVVDNKENFEQFTNVAPPVLRDGSAKKKKKGRRSSINNRRVSFSHLVDVRIFDKDANPVPRQPDAMRSRSNSDIHPAVSSILAEEKADLKAAHVVKEGHIIPPMPKPYGGYDYSPSKNVENEAREQEEVEEPYKPAVVPEQSNTPQKSTANKGNRIVPEELSVHVDLPRPTSSVPTLEDLLGKAGMSPCKWERSTKSKSPRKQVHRDSISGLDVSDMDITLNTPIPDKEDRSELEESADTTASNILASIGKQHKDPLVCEDSFDDQYNNDVDNYVVNYDSDVSITIPLRSFKVPGYTNLHDEEEGSNSNNNNFNSRDTSNNSELDMSMTRTYSKFNTTNDGNITSHFVSDMSLTRLEVDTSADMSMTRVDIGKFITTESQKMKFSVDDSVDMSMTNMRFPDANVTRHFASDDMSLTRVGGFGDNESDGDMSFTCNNIDASQLSNTSTSSDAKFAGYNSTVNNFVVTYDEDMSVTMSLTRARELALAEEAEEETVAPVAPSIPEPSKYNTAVNNYVVSYDDDDMGMGSANESLQCDISGNNDMTLTRTDFGKMAEDDISMTMTRTDLGKIAATMDAQEELDDSVTGKKRKMEPDTAPSNNTPNIFTKILTPSKSHPRTPITPQVPAMTTRTSLTPQFTLPPSNFQDGQETKLVPATPTDEKLSTVEEFLNGSKYIAPVDASRFSFSRFLQLANLRFYQQRVSTLGALKRAEVEEDPSAVEILESAFITRHDFNDLQTSGEQLRALAVEKKQLSEKIESLLARSPEPPKLYTQLQSSDPEEVTQAIKRANKLMSMSKVQSKVEFLERRQQLEQRSLAVKRHGLELLRQDAARLTNMVKSLKALTDELPNDIKILEQTKRNNAQQQHQLTQPKPQATPSPASGVLPKYFLSTGSQTDGRKSSKRARTEKADELQRVMNEDFDFLQFMQKSLHWVPRVFNETELLFHWDFYKIHIFLDPNTSTVKRSIFSLINPHQRLNDFHVGVMRSAQIQHMLKELNTADDLVPVLQKVFHRLQRVRLIFNTVKRLSAHHHVKTDSKFIRHKPTNEKAGVIEIQFSDHRATTKFGVVFELTCAYPFSELVAIPRQPLFGNVTTEGIKSVLNSIEPGYERMERICAALVDLAVEGKDPVTTN